MRAKERTGVEYVRVAGDPEKVVGLPWDGIRLLRARQSVECLLKIFPLGYFPIDEFPLTEMGVRFIFARYVLSLQPLKMKRGTEASPIMDT